MLLLLAGAVAASAQELPVPDSWVPYLRPRKDKLPRCIVEWKVERRLPKDPAKLPILSALLDTRIEHAQSEQDKAKLQNEAAPMAERTAKIFFTVRLDYYTSDRFFIRQSMPDETGRSPRSYTGEEWLRKTSADAGK